MSEAIGNPGNLGFSLGTNQGLSKELDMQFSKEGGIVAAALAGTLILSSWDAPARAAEVITNGGFETGALSPWFYGRGYPMDSSDPDWSVTNTTAASGQYSATVGDNYELRQNFAPVAVGSITGITFDVISPFMAIDLFYSSGADDEFTIQGPDFTWVSYNITSHLDLSQKDLTGISFWGVTCQCSIYLDNVSITTATVPEPATWAMLLVGFLGVGAMARTARRSAD